jgi:chromate transporter
MEIIQIPRLKELIAVFFKLGATAFGGPAAHLAAIEQETVERQAWLSSEHLLRLYGLTNILPGPNSTELVVAIGRERAGNLGAIVAGISFILPAMFLVWVLAIFYQQFQFIPQLQHIFAGMQPVIAAIVAQALWKLSRSNLKDGLTKAIGIATTLACLAGVNELFWLLLMGGGLALGRNWHKNSHLSVLALLPSQSLWGLKISPELTVLGIFLKIGLLAYGGGYVLIAFLQQELVERQHLITSRQLLDAVAIGQVTPGPLFTTATFVGYLLAGHGGAIAATIGIFLPGFLAMAIFHPQLEKWQQSPWLQDFLAGIVPATWGLMAAVSWNLIRALHGWPSYGIALGSLILLLHRPSWSLGLLAIGALLGGLFYL